MGVLNTVANTPTVDLRKNKFNKSRVNCTTQDFFAIKPVYSAEVMANEDCTINMAAFTRLAPMVRPTYARCKMVNRAFFVPYRTIWRPWNAFITQDYFEDGVIPTAVPQFRIYSMYYLFLDGTTFHTTSHAYNREMIVNAMMLHDTLPDEQSKENILNFFKQVNDVTLYVPVDAIMHTYLETYGVDLNDALEGTFLMDGVYYVPFFKFDFGIKAKRIYDILVNLGYNISLDFIAASNTEFSLTDDDNIVMDNTEPNLVDSRCLSAMPLLSFLKVWSDWYRFNQWSPSFDGVFVENFFSIGTTNYLTFFNTARLKTLFKFLLINQYDKDYFTCAELEPIGRFDSQSITIPDNTLGSSDNNVVSNSSNNFTPVMEDEDNTSTFSQFAIDGLRRLTNFMMRYKIAGGKILDRMLLQYGVKLDSEKLQRSVYLGKYEQPIQISDVTATSASQIDGDTQYLGDYAGKGISQGQGHFELKHNKEFGQMLVLSLVAPEISYFQGLKREMVHLNKFDFFDGNFDGLGYQAVMKSEVMNVYQPAQAMRTELPDGTVVEQRSVPWLYKQVTSDGVFGFLPRYAEYKQSDNADILSGDYRVHSAGSESLRYFNLFRELTMSNFDLVNNAVQMQQCPSFSWVNDASQYDKIFSDTSETFDHFLTFFSFDVVSYQPSKQLFDSYDFGDDNEHNKHIKMSFGGTRF